MPEHIVVTGPLAGWINRRDQWHTWSVSVIEGLTPPLITCESVIAETAWHLRESREAVDQLYSLVVAGALRIAELLPDHVPHLEPRVPQNKCLVANPIFPVRQTGAGGMEVESGFQLSGCSPLGMRSPDCDSLSDRSCKNAYP
jgi:hypothetical protein